MALKVRGIWQNQVVTEFCHGHLDFWTRYTDFQFHLASEAGGWKLTEAEEGGGEGYTEAYEADKEGRSSASSFNLHDRHLPRARRLEGAPRVILEFPYIVLVYLFAFYELIP